MGDLSQLWIMLLVSFMASLRCLNSSPRVDSILGTGSDHRPNIANASETEPIKDRQSKSSETLDAALSSKPTGDGEISRRGEREGKFYKSETRCLGAQVQVRKNWKHVHNHISCLVLPLVEPGDLYCTGSTLSHHHFQCFVGSQCVVCLRIKIKVDIIGWRTMGITMGGGVQGNPNRQIVSTQMSGQTY